MWQRTLSAVTSPAPSGVSTFSTFCKTEDFRKSWCTHYSV